MTLLVRAKDVLGRPVVTLGGEDVAQVKDVVYLDGRAQVVGFTLNGRGLLAGPLKTALAWTAVVGLGRDAVMVADEEALTPRQALLDAAGGGGDVLGSRVLTDTGVDLGEVVDVVLEVAGDADVVGYEIDSTSSLGKDGRRVFVPLPDTLAVSAQALVVPASVVDFVTDDLAGFGASVQAFRTHHASGEGGGRVRFSEASGRAVLDTSTAETVGKVDAFLVDPVVQRVVALRLKRKGDQDVVRWSALSAFGPDAVTVPGEQALTASDDALDALAGKAGALLKKRVLTTGGDAAGTVRDVEFDPADGRIVRLLTSEGEVDGALLRGVGSYAVVVEVPPTD